MVYDIKNVKEWIHNWFPYFSEVVAKDQTSSNASKNLVTDSSGEVTVENKISAGSGLSLSNTNQMSHSNSVTGGALTTATLKKIKYDAQGHITETANVNISDFPNIDAEDVYFEESYTQSVTNVEEALLDLDGRITGLSSIKAIEVVSTLPNASSSTMGKLYIISESNKVNVYYTEQSGSSYSWHKMDTDILDDLSVAWSDITDKPSFGTGQNDFARGNHGHGQINSSGTITDTAVTVASNDCIVITDTSDSSKIKRAYNLTADHIKDASNHTHIGSSGGDTQSTINSAIDTALSNKANSVHTHSNYVTSIALVPKGNDPSADAYNGVIKLYYGDEPSS